MRHLILVRHSQVQIEAGVLSRLWRLTAEGQRRCQALADRLKPYSPPQIITSTEPKAIDTGKLAAERLGIPCQTATGLHEHERDNVGFFPSKEADQAAVASLVRHPDKRVFGQETAQQAQTRFSRAVQAIIDNQPEGNVVIVAHGTVISLFVAAYADIDIVAFWKALGLPAMVILSRPAFDLVEVVNDLV